ncbi:hypothetical protein J7E25_17025 [Agromyces sp. ISL-38]|uniref:hypothetical protein n=1 Tax=Agromyces sp. ISL-38 TaxID=2819107 RepID=UPI001BECB25E|nr:hypothetical protein [Agromyces sp. ISL-38]MBT2500801.1 hypothetical protein [Agromyces sp. ISL-38]
MDHRADPTHLPELLETNQVQVSNTGPNEWHVSGLTEAQFHDHHDDYAWTCRVTIDEAQRILTADLLSIEKVSP